jgi:hypothetical protein
MTDVDGRVTVRGPRGEYVATVRGVTTPFAVGTAPATVRVLTLPVGPTSS